MLKTNRFALVLGLGFSLAAQALAQGEPVDQQPASPAEPAAPRPPRPAKGDPNEYKSYPGFKSQAELEERRAALERKRTELKEKRSARFELQLKRMRERAVQLRNQAATKTNELDKEEVERRAQRLEQKATDMEQRREKVATMLKDRPAAGNPPTEPRLAREQRSKVRKAQMRRRWGKLLLREDVLAELRSHAQRTARLRRVRELARGANQEELTQRSIKLLAKEQQGHLRRMQAFERSQSPDTAKEEAAPNQPAAVQPSEVQPAQAQEQDPAAAPKAPEGSEAKP